MRLKPGLTIVALLCACLLWSAAAQAQRQGVVQAEAATDPWPGSYYKMTDDSDRVEMAKVTHFRINSNEAFLKSFNMEVTWDSTKVSLGSYEETNYFRSTVGFSDSTEDQGAGYIRLTYTLSDSADFYGFEDLIEFIWTTPCQVDGATNVLSIDPYDQDNVFVIGQTAYRPATATNGHANIITYTGDIWPVGVSGPKATDLKVPLKIVNNFHPQGAITASVRYDTLKLAYQGFDTVGTYAQGVGHISITQTKDTLAISDSGYYAKTDTTVWMYLVFRNTISDTNQSTQVTVTKWEQKSSCSLALVGDTTDQSATVSTPAYIADLYYQDGVSMYTNSERDMYVQLINNFYVDMATTETGLKASFRPDADLWTILDTSVTTTNPTTRGSLSFYWSRRTGLSASVKMIWEDPSNSSDSIPPSSTRANVAKLHIKSKGSAGSENVNFRADSTGGSFYKEDSKIKAMSPAYVLHTTPYGSDGRFRVHGNTVSVSNPPPPPSCPYVSVWNGSQFAEENTILTESEYTAEGTPVVDYYPLKQQPVLKDGAYQLRIEEREDETSYLDELKLLVVETEPGRQVAVTPDGEFFYAQLQITPVVATDFLGRDVLDLVREEDGKMYTSYEPGWLIVTYEPTESEAGRVFVGHAVAAKGQPPCDPEDGPQGPKIARDDLNPGDQLERAVRNRLRVSYRENGGPWIALPETPPRENNVPTFTGTDLTIRAGTRIEVKYEWGYGWLANELPLVVSSELIRKPLELSPVAAFHSSAGKVAGTVTTADNEFTVLNKGERLEVYYPAGRRPSRTTEPLFVLMAKGYYTPYRQSATGTLPKSFALHPNHPNPFNAETRIAFALPSDADVHIDVFNVIGQKVKTLVSGLMEAGEHSVVWDGKNEQGGVVASGTYFFRMRAGDFEQNRKMTLLK